MPASSSDAMQKWKRTSKGPKTTKRHRVEDEEYDDEEDDNNNNNNNKNKNNNNNDITADDDEDLHPNPNPRNQQTAEVLPGTAVRVSDFPPAVKYVVNRAHSSVHKQSNSGGLVLENISYGQLQVLSAVPADNPALVGPDQESSVVISPPPIMEGTGITKCFWNRPHLLPLHADWFEPTAVHRLERQVVPHFFSGKSAQHTPQKYLDCRNLIVAKYIENPEKAFSIGDCQGAEFSIDSEDVARIFRFLDHWGIINYCAPVPPPDSWSIMSYLREDPKGEVFIPSATLKSIDSLIKFNKPKCQSKPSGGVYSSLSSNCDDLADLDSIIRERLSENRCNYCSRPLLVVYYQSVRDADTLLCPDCYHEGRLVVGHSSLDFIKADAAAEYGDHDGDSWSDQETLLLLEAVEIYNDNWNDIADHVGTKSKAQCILHFLRLPMEDGLLENVEVPHTLTPSNGSNGGSLCLTANGISSGIPAQDSDTEKRFPFANSGNPVIGLVAFLASAVGPRIAAACAHASLAALSEDERPLHGNRMDSDDGPLETKIFSQPREDKSTAQGSGISNNVNTEASPLSEEKVKYAAKAGMAAAALKAKLFADHEEREIQRLSANIINHQLKRLELKLKQFAEVETLLMKECEQVEKTRQRISGERTRILAARFGPIPSSGSMPGGVPQVVNNNISNSRPMGMSASPSQPGVSGYASNQMSHSQMPFSPRQQIFSFGPRLPLSALHPPSSGPSSSNMFGSQGNSQSSLNHPVLRPVPGTSSGMG